VNYKSVNVNNKGKNLKRIRITICGGVSAASDGLYGFEVMKADIFRRNESEWFGTCYSFQKT